MGKNKIEECSECSEIWAWAVGIFLFLMIAISISLLILLHKWFDAAYGIAPHGHEISTPEAEPHDPMPHRHPFPPHEHPHTHPINTNVS